MNLQLQKEITILLVEDDDGHAVLVKRNLKKIGITNKILRFRDGQEIIDFLHKEVQKNESLPSFIMLLDIRMPRMDGYEVLEHVKSSPELTHIPVIMVTSTDDEKEIRHCHKLGCNGYLIKPVNYQKFAESIEQIGKYLSMIQIP